MSRYNPFQLFVGSFIPNWLQKRKEISSHAKIIFARLAQYAGKDGDCRPSQDTLAEETGLEYATMRRGLKELIDFKLIEAERQGMQKPNRYHFLKHEWMAEQSRVRAGEQSDRAPVSNHDDAPVSNKENHGRESKKSTEPGAALSLNLEASGKYEGMAEEIYKAYPVPAARPKALAAIKKAIEAHGAEHILKRTLAYSRARNGNKEFVPLPATWFNQERYNDDPATWVPRRNGRESYPAPVRPSFEKELEQQRAEKRAKGTLIEDLKPSEILAMQEKRGGENGA